jgi:hypothetical protein
MVVLRIVSYSRFAASGEFALDSYRKAGSFFVSAVTGSAGWEEAGIETEGAGIETEGAGIETERVGGGTGGRARSWLLIALDLDLVTASVSTSLWSSSSLTVTITAWFDVTGSHCRKKDSVMKAEPGMSEETGCEVGSRRGLSRTIEFAPVAGVDG